MLACAAWVASALSLRWIVEFNTGYGLLGLETCDGGSCHSFSYASIRESGSFLLLEHVLLIATGIAAAIALWLAVRPGRRIAIVAIVVGVVGVLGDIGAIAIAQHLHPNVLGWAPYGHLGGAWLAFLAGMTLRVGDEVEIDARAPISGAAGIVLVFGFAALIAIGRSPAKHGERREPPRPTLDGLDQRCLMMRTAPAGAGLHGYPDDGPTTIEVPGCFVVCAAAEVSGWRPVRASPIDTGFMRASDVVPDDDPRCAMPAPGSP
jgi:hypothetical protein